MVSVTWNSKDMHPELTIGDANTSRTVSLQTRFGFEGLYFAVKNIPLLQIKDYFLADKLWATQTFSAYVLAKAEDIDGDKLAWPLAFKDLLSYEFPSLTAYEGGEVPAEYGDFEKPEVKAKLAVIETVLSQDSDYWNWHVNAAKEAGASEWNWQPV